MIRQPIVFGFDRASQSWITESSGLSAARVPKLDGALLIDEAALRAAGQDFGNLHHQQPLAVLEPGSREDIVNMVNFAREHGIKIGPRGQGNSAFGQSQVAGGLVIKMNALEVPPVFGPNRVEVSSGLTWRQVLASTLEHSLRPPVMTQTLYLSVGGTLSIGGVDGGSYRYGAQVDNVLELQVVTGEGRLETCSASQLPELFEAVLSGRGQCGIIVRATLRLIPAETNALFCQLLYRDLPTMLDDLRMVIADGRFDRTSAYAQPSSSGWAYYLQGARNFTPPELPNEDAMFANLHHIRGFERVTNSSFFDYADRGGRHKDNLSARGRLSLHHPWFDAFIPDSSMNEFTAEVFDSLDPALIEPDFPIEFYGFNTQLCTRPLFRLPDEPVAFLIDVLTTYADAEIASQMVKRNRRFFERARELGGKIYPSGATPLTQEDWPLHYAPFWEQFASAKRRFDPDNILAPGPGIF
jgi:cytokinin dehydrogenase